MFKSCTQTYPLNTITAHLYFDHSFVSLYCIFFLGGVISIVEIVVGVLDGVEQCEV